MNQKTSNSLLKNDIAEALILLLQRKELDAISISEIVEKAGVNRSTYYRNYNNKQEVVRHYYACRLDEALEQMQEGISLKDYFVTIFVSFRKYKKELQLLDYHALSHLLLDEMNYRVFRSSQKTGDELLSFYGFYHIGGVFNSFCFWLREDMATTPEELADKCIAILPKEFSPKLAGDLYPMK